MVPITYAWTNGRTDKQTDEPHRRDEPNCLTKPDGLDISTDGHQGQTDKLDGPTNGRTENLANRLTKQTNWKEGLCGRPNRLDGRTDKPEGRTDQTDQTTEQTDWVDGQMHQTNGIEEMDTRTNGSEAWTDETDKRTRQMDGLTN